MSQGTEAERHRAQMENSKSAGRTRADRTLQNKGEWKGVREALNLGLSPHQFWDIGP